MVVPLAPVKLMTSPGLMDRSISSTKPLTKLLAMACRPKPRPIPSAPVKTVSVRRSSPAWLEADQDAENDQERVDELRRADSAC